MGPRRVSVREHTVRVGNQSRRCQAFTPLERCRRYHGACPNRTLGRGGEPAVGDIGPSAVRQVELHKRTPAPRTDQVVDPNQ
jgi:hypothetical protein